MNPKWISRGFLRGIMERLEIGCHAALIAPRQSAKAVVLFELKRLAEELPAEQRPHVVILRGTKLRNLREAEFLMTIALNLGVHVASGAKWESAPLTEKIIELLRVSIRQNKCRRLWLFVQNLTELPWPHARALLSVFQVAAEDSELKRYCSVVVTGSRELVPLTYSENSPYRHADRYFLVGLDREFSEQFFRARLAGASLEYGFQESPELDRFQIDPEAMDLLWKETGGYAKFLEEIVVATKRPVPNGAHTVVWTLERTRQFIDLFVDDFMHKEYDCGLSLSEVEKSPPAWELLQKLVDCPEEGLALDGGSPHPLDISGIVRRDPDGKAFISSPIWRRFLQQRLVEQRQHRADTYALLGNWSKAWSLYESEDSSISDRVLDGIERISLTHVLDAWENSFDDMVGNGPFSVVEQFAYGARHLLGFSWLKIVNGSAGKIFQEMPATMEIPDLESPRNMKDISEGNKDFDLWKLKDPYRFAIKSTPKLIHKNEQLPATIQLEAACDAGRESDSVSIDRIRRSLGRFWQAYRAAFRFEYDATIGALREKHLSAIQQINELLSFDPGDMRSVVQGTAQALVDVADYYRILICLVSPLGDRIQAVTSFCKDPSSNFNYVTDYALDANSPEDNWDVQQWATIKGVTVRIRNASDRSQCRPCTQWEKVSLIGMEAIVVVPLKLCRRTRDGKKEEILGTIHFERMDRKLPNEEEIRLSEILASQIAVAFDHAHRTTLLEQTLHQLDDPIRVLSTNNRDVIFRNRAAAKLDCVSQPGWATASTADDGGRRALLGDASLLRSYVVADQSYVVADEKIWDELKAPLQDFRAQLEKPYECQGQIGIVQHRHELTELFTAYVAFQRWLRGKDIEQTVAAILDYFKTLTKWCRIYRIQKEPSGEERLESFAEFGISDERIARQFRQGAFWSDRCCSDHQAWFLLDDFREPALFRYDSNHHGKPIRQDSSGVPTFITADHWREEFCKTEGEWIEAPLIVGHERIGLIAVQKRADFSPKMYEQFRWCVGSAAVAIWKASQTEQIAIQREKAWKEASQLAIHQLTNKLLPVQNAVENAQKLLQLNVISRLHHQLKVAQHGVDSSWNILRNFTKYASDKPFTDEADYPVSKLLSQIEGRLRDVETDVWINVTSTIETVEIIRTSLVALLEVFEILLSNSIVHSRKSKTDLKIEISATAINPPFSHSRRLCITYSDNGCGISKEHRDKIFNAFFTTHAQGSGLGLVIAQRFMNRLRGQIELATDESLQGATFILSLPLNHQ